MPIYATDALVAGELLHLTGHVGIFIGNGQVLHPPKTGDVAKSARSEATGSKNYLACDE